MSNAIVPVVPKRNAVTGAGYPTSLALGELAVNTTTGDVYLGADPGVVQIGVALAAGTTLNLGTGDGSTVAFTIAGGTGTDAGGYLVSVGGIDQPSGWTVAGTTLTFLEAPPADAEVSVRAILKGIGGGGGGTDIGGRAWAVGATYTQGDLVATSQRETWICIENANTGHDPVSSPEWWAPQPADAVSLQLRAVAATAPTDGQFLMWSAANNQWEPTTLAGGSVTFNTEGTHTWTVPANVRVITIDGASGNGGDGGPGGAGGDGGDGAMGGSETETNGQYSYSGANGGNGGDGGNGGNGGGGGTLVVSAFSISISGGDGGPGGAGGDNGDGGAGGQGAGIWGPEGPANPAQPGTAGTPGYAGDAGGAGQAGNPVTLYYPTNTFLVNPGTIIEVILGAPTSGSAGTTGADGGSPNGGNGADGIVGANGAVGSCTISW